MEGLVDDALSCEGGVAVEKDGHHLHTSPAPGDERAGEQECELGTRLPLTLLPSLSPQ